MSYDGIYKYELKDLTSSRVIDLATDFYGVIATSDDTIYFDNFIAYGTDNILFQFSASTNQVRELEIPGDWLPPYEGLLVDDSQRLWLGSTGYLDSDGTWHLIYPFSSLPSEHTYTIGWSPPVILMQDSDGKLWFRKYTGLAGQFEGTAWYDPDTGEGCLITNWPSNVVEDDERNLWILVEETLYRRSLDSE